MADITKVNMGQCSVTIGGVDIGHTKGGVEVTYEPVWKDVTVDLYGESAVTSKLVGEKLSAKIPFAESTIANFLKAMPAGTSAGSAGRVTLGQKAGLDGLTLAAQVVLHPLAMGSSRANDVVMHKALSKAPITLPFKVDEQTVYSVEMQAFIDESKANGNYLGLIGDSAAV